MSAVDRDEALRELGRMSKEIREDAGLSLEDVFERTRVRVAYLRGIEQGAYQGFPDLVYIKGFVRTYLSVIGADELKDEFMTWLNKDNAPAERRLPPANVLGNTTYPTKGFKLASHFWLFVILLLIMSGSGYYVWYAWHNNPVWPDSRFGQSQTNLADTPGAPVSIDTSADAALSSQDNFLSVLPPVISVEPEPEPEPVSPYLHIIATGEVWVEVTIDGRVVLSRTLQRGNEASWDLPARARVRYGRADATVILNGKQLQNASGRGTYYYDPDGTFSR